MTFRIGLVLGAIIAVLVGAWFIYITATAEGVAGADLALLAGLVAFCVVVAVVLALAAEFSLFFPGLGVGFSLPAALASLACAVISAFNGWGDAAVRFTAVMFALVVCFFIIRAIAPRMYARS